MFGEKMSKVMFQYSSRVGQMFEGHQHHEIEIYFLVSGQRYYFINNQTHLVMPRDIVIIPEDLYHRVFSAGYGKYERYILYIDRKFAAENLSTRLAEVLFDVLDRKAFVHRLQSPAKIESIFRDMLAEGLHESKSPESLPILNALGAELLNELTQSLADEPPAAAKISYVNKNILQIAAYINQNYQQKITLDMLAEKFNLSKYYLCKLFKSSFGYTFSDFLNHVRITEAGKLLESTSSSVSDISAATGFSDIAYFCRIFKKIMGVSALKYRKSSQK
jgi:YesN/AraC family two-component response regulator